MSLGFVHCKRVGMELLTRIDDFDLLEGRGDGKDQLSMLVSKLTLVTLPELCNSVTRENATPARFSPYVISTMTMLSDIGTRVDIDLVFRYIPCLPDGTTGAVLNARLSSTKFRGVYEPKKKRLPRKVFLNQITFDVGVGEFRKISIKLFRDGHLQLAGCKSEEEAVTALGRLTAALSRIKDVEGPASMQLKLTDAEHASVYENMGAMNDRTFRQYLYELRTHRHKGKPPPSYDVSFTSRAVEAEEVVVAVPPRIVMINSDFDTGVPIDKEAFVKYMRDVHGLFCRPFCSSYPGANVKFVSNIDCRYGCKENSEKTKCNDLRKRRLRSSACVAVSVLAFSAGKIIMTGAQSTRQLDQVYTFLQRAFLQDYDCFRPKHW